MYLITLYGDSIIIPFKKNKAKPYSRDLAL